VAFRAAATLVAATNGGQMTRLDDGRQQPRMIQWSHRKTPSAPYADLVYFLDGQARCRATRATPQTGLDGKPDTTTAILPFKVKLTVRSDEEFTEMFEPDVALLSEELLRREVHGAATGTRCGRKVPALVKYVAMKEDLYALLYLDDGRS